MEKNLNDIPNSNSADDKKLDSNSAGDKKLKNKKDLDLKTITKRFNAAAVLDLKATMKKIIVATEYITRTTYLLSQFFVVMSFISLGIHLANYLDYRNTFLAKFIDYSLPTISIGFLIVNLILGFFCIIYLKYKFKYSNSDIENIKGDYSMFWATCTYILYLSFIGIPTISFITNIF